MRKHKDKFVETKHAVEELNKSAKGKAKFELNFFADVLDEELSFYFGNFDDSSLENPGFEELDGESQGRKLQEDLSVNWATSGHLTPVKD